MNRRIATALITVGLLTAGSAGAAAVDFVNSEEIKNGTIRTLAEAPVALGHQ